jgi:phage terminase Nu1 subunit (DNA packaging protein)
MPMTSRLWTISGLATELGRDRRTISAALRTVPPDGKSGRYNAWRLSTAMEALGGRDGAKLDLTTERARLAKLRADAIAMKNAQMRGELLPFAEVLATNQAILSAVRARLLALPSRLAQPSALASDPAEVQELLRVAIYDVLTELSELTFEDEDTDEN